MAMASKVPPIVVIAGDEEFQKDCARRETLDRLLPPDVDRTLALTIYDGSLAPDQGGPALAAVMDDLNTLPFLTDRRVVLIREADKFISANREVLERYATAPSATATLILECRTFPKATRLYKAIAPAGGTISECKKLSGRALVDFVVEEARARGKVMDAGAAGQLVGLIGPDQGQLASEVEKLALYALGRKEISAGDVLELVGLSREEKIFAVMDAAAAGNLPQALDLWRQVVQTDPAAVFKAVGGIAFVLRRWLAAHEMLADGMSIFAIAPKVMMWGRDRELAGLLKRLSATSVARLLAELAELDAQAKTGVRSIEMGVESLLVRAARSAA